MSPMISTFLDGVGVVLILALFVGAPLLLLAYGVFLGLRERRMSRRRIETSTADMPGFARTETIPRETQAPMALGESTQPISHIVDSPNPQDHVVGVAPSDQTRGVGRSVMPTDTYSPADAEDRLPASLEEARERAAIEKESEEERLRKLRDDERDRRKVA